MPAPIRTVGLHYHLLYPLISFILLAIPSFTTADSIWYLSTSTSTEIVRFAAQDYCGYNVSNAIITHKLGCIYRGNSYQIPDDYFGFPIPADVSNNLSRVAVTSVVAFALVTAGAVHHAYTIKYSFRVTPEPGVNELYSFVQIHFISVIVIFLFTWIAFIAQATVIGHATSQSGDSSTENGVAITWGQSPWLVLAAAIVNIGWGIEAVRWRAALVK